MKNLWGALPYCDADRIEFEPSAIGDTNATDFVWPSGDVMKNAFAKIAAMPLLDDIVAEAGSVRSLALRDRHYRRNRCFRHAGHVGLFW